MNDIFSQFLFLVPLNLLLLIVILFLKRNARNKIKATTLKQHNTTVLKKLNTMDTIKDEEAKKDLETEKLKEENRELKDQILKDKELLSKIIKEKELEIEELKKKKKQVVVEVSSFEPESSFDISIFSASGPRKDLEGSDSELSEDVVGFKCSPNEVFFWLLDGTSDNPHIPLGGEIPYVFSSRVLAQKMGDFFSTHIESYFKKEQNFDKLIADAIQKIINDFNVHLEEGVSEEVRSNITAKISRGHKPTCSTTLILGFLNTRGDFYGLRTGDSKAVPFIKDDNGGVIPDPDCVFAFDPKEECDRIALRLTYSEDTQKIGIITNPTYKKLSGPSKNVLKLLVFSDGLGRIFEKDIRENYTNALHKLSSYPQKTFDDKSLIIIERSVKND